MKKYKVAFHCFCLLVLFSTTGLAGVLNVEFVDIYGKPIPFVTLTFTGFQSGYAITGADGKIAINYPSPGTSPSFCLGISSAFYPEKPGIRFNHERGDYFLRVPCNDSPVMYLRIIGTDLPPITNVSSADYQARFTSDMIVSAFGNDLATSVETATTLPLKTTLAGRRLLITDGVGVERAARLLFVSPTQINYIASSELAVGRGVVKLVDENGTVLKAGFIFISKVSPNIFTADASGRGVPAAATVRASSGYQVYDLVYQFDPASQRVVPAEIDLAGESETVLLVLFGTGWRQVDSVSNVQVKIGGIDCPVEYAGKQTSIEGLDQINVRLPRALIGKGNVNVEVSIDGNQANLVQLRIK